MRVRTSCVLSFVYAVRAFGAQIDTGNCDAEEKEMRLAWARERIYPSASSDQLKKVYFWLLQATRRGCPNDGDLWYYRGLLEPRFGRAKPSEIKGWSEEHPSEAQKKGLNPLVGDVAAPKKKVAPYVRDKWALLVGIEQFSDEKIPRLQFAANDAVRLGKLLTGPEGRFDPSHVTVLTNKDATKNAILTALGDIRGTAKEDDLVFVYISSHGYPGDQDPTGVSFVVTYDTDISRPGTVYASSLAMVELADFSRMLKSQRFVLMLDTCFGGGAVANAKTIVPLGDKPIDSFTGALHGMETGSGRAILTASRATERSYESPSRKNGYFTYFLIEALQQHEGLDNLKTIYSSVQRKVSDAVKEEVGQSQNPILDQTESGDEIVLGVKPVK